jgi:hypothetical protein
MACEQNVEEEDHDNVEWKRRDCHGELAGSPAFYMGKRKVIPSEPHAYLKG